MPSHRFPSLTSDGRYVFYSSDAGGEKWFDIWKLKSSV